MNIQHLHEQVRNNAWISHHCHNVT